eukprot:3936954-Rhodomonas_salina.2
MPTLGSSSWFPSGCVRAPGRCPLVRDQRPMRESLLKESQTSSRLRALHMSHDRELLWLGKSTVRPNLVRACVSQRNQGRAAVFLARNVSELSEFEPARLRQGDMGPGLNCKNTQLHSTHRVPEMRFLFVCDMRGTETAPRQSHVINT